MVHRVVFFDALDEHTALTLAKGEQLLTHRMAEDGVFTTMERIWVYLDALQAKMQKEPKERKPGRQGNLGMTKELYMDMSANLLVLYPHTHTQTHLSCLYPG